MSWIDIAWPMMAAASLTLGLIHLLIWLRQRASRAHLAFALAALSVATFTVFELLALRAQTPAPLGTIVRWAHVPTTVLVLSLIWFVHLFLGAGRRWLGVAAGGLRVLGLALNFLTGVNLNFRSIEAVRHIEWWGGDVVAYAVGEPNPWVLVAQASNLLLVAYLVDALVTVWRRGDRAQRKRALVVCGGWLVFLVVMITSAILMTLNAMKLPFLGSASFVVVIAAMSYELGSDLLRATQLASRLQVSEDRMRESERSLELATHAAGLGVWSWDIVRDHVWMTEQARALAGFESEAEMTLERFLAQVHPDDRDDVRAAVDEAMHGSGDYEREYRVVLPDGNTRWIADRGQVEFGPDGAPLRMYGVAQDVTDRRQAEEQFRMLVEAAPSAMLLISQDGGIAQVNAEAERVFGYAREDLLGRSIEQLIPERYRAAHLHHRSAFAADPRVRAMGAGRELYGRCKDGGEIPIEVGLSPIQSAEGNFVLASVTDISERLRKNRESAQQRDELAHLSRVAMLGELSGSLAHELNQPLAAILSNAQAAQRFLRREHADLGEVRGILVDIIENDRRAGEVIRRLRALLKKEQAQHQSLDLNEVVQDVLRLMRSDLLNRDVVVAVELAPDVPPVVGDRVQLQQVLLNLVANACDAVESVDRHKVVVRTASSDGMVQASVSDCGPGVAPDCLERIFEPFVTTKREGMGLGLAVCRSIVDAHGGRMWASNNPERGATVHFVLPVSG